MTKIVPHKMVNHGHERIDNYFWLHDRENPEVIAWLEAENARTEEALAHTSGLQETIFEEIKGRMKKEDMTVPYRLRDYYYYTRYEKETEYGIECRKHLTLEADEEILLDGNQLAENEAYMRIRGMTVSSGQNILAFAVDNRGNRIYTIRFKDLDSGDYLEDTLTEVTGSSAWARDNKTLFYARHDPVTLRPNRIFKHVLGTDPAEDVLVYEETDETFRVTVCKSRSRRFIFIWSAQTLTYEFRMIDADNPDGPMKTFLARRRGHEYLVDHHDGGFYILSNDKAKNFRLLHTSEDCFEESAWQELVPHREDVYIENFELFDNYLVTEERTEGLTHLRVYPKGGGNPYELDFGEPAYLAHLGTNPEADTDVLRFGYTSMTTPSSVYDFHMGTHDKKLMKRQVVVGEFDPAHYRTERVHAKAHDGRDIPISMVYRIDQLERGKNPLVLYGYGAYGSSVDPVFSQARLSLLDRGFVYAIAHVRGGHELGRDWYDEGKLEHKLNSFKDFISCAHHLKDSGFADGGHMYAKGGSAGGLLVGAVINMEPDLFHGVVAQVPFVDVLTTMLDPELPLTTGEYDEWGHPEREDEYHCMLQYSPYDNVTAKAYPNLLVTSGINDTQVHYWEPAKWVAKLRALKTDDHLLLLKTDLEVGHGGASGRFKQIHETALTYAFLLHLAGKADH